MSVTVPLLNPARTTLLADYHAGDGAMTVQTPGAMGTPPVQFSVQNVAGVMAVYQATGSSPTQLTGVTAIDGTTDQYFPQGSMLRAGTANAAGGGSGTVSSVGLTVPSWMTEAGTPVTGAGTLAVTPAGGQAANQVLATPSGAPGALGLRSLAAADLPAHSAALITSGVPAGLLYGSSGAFAGAASWNIGSSGQLSGTAIGDPGSPGAGDLWVSSGQGVLSFLDAGLLTRAGGVFWQALSAGTAIANSTSNLSLLTGFTATLGTLTIPANSLTLGKIIRPTFWGTTSNAGSVTITLTIYLGGTSIWSLTTATLSATTTSSLFVVAPSGYGAAGLQIQGIGGSGKVSGVLGALVASAGSVAAIYSGTNTAASANVWIAPVPVTINTTGPLTFDLKAQWSALGAGNSIQLTGGFLTIDG
jgi:hypothetical protein